jgi:hypothetical protein
MSAVAVSDVAHQRQPETEPAAGLLTADEPVDEVAGAVRRGTNPLRR